MVFYAQSTTAVISTQLGEPAYNKSTLLLVVVFFFCWIQRSGNTDHSQLFPRIRPRQDKQIIQKQISFFVWF